jgi:hypothetical protein
MGIKLYKKVPSSASSLHFTSLHFTSLHFTSLHFFLHIQSVHRRSHMGPWNIKFVHSNIYHQSRYSKTNVMHFLFNLLRIKGLYMFRALLAHPPVEWNSNPSAANRHTTHAVYQLLFVQRLLKMSK